jgi:hypothetical protein
MHMCVFCDVFLLDFGTVLTCVVFNVFLLDFGTVLTCVVFYVRFCCGICCLPLDKYCFIV